MIYEKVVFDWLRRTVLCHATQEVGHRDEAASGDVGVIAGLVQLLLGCVVARKAFGRLLGREKKTTITKRNISVKSHCVRVQARVCAYRFEEP